jgi:hypothetical protein
MVYSNVPFVPRQKLDGTSFSMDVLQRKGNTPLTHTTRSDNLVTYTHLISGCKWLVNTALCRFFIHIIWKQCNTDFHGTHSDISLGCQGKEAAIAMTVMYHGQIYPTDSYHPRRILLIAVLPALATRPHGMMQFLTLLLGHLFMKCSKRKQLANGSRYPS